MRPVLIRPRLLRAFARLAIAVFCAHAAQPLAAALHTANAPPPALAICTATGLKVVLPHGESAPAPDGPATGGHCAFCCVGGAALPPPVPHAPVPPAPASHPIAPAPPDGPGSDLLRPAARGPPAGMAG